MSPSASIGIFLAVFTASAGLFALNVQRLARYAVLRGWHVLGVTASPLRGPKGNREFFLHLSMHGRTAANLEGIIDRTVQALA